VWRASNPYLISRIALSGPRYSSHNTQPGKNDGTDSNLTRRHCIMLAPKTSPTMSTINRSSKVQRTYRLLQNTAASLWPNTCLARMLHCRFDGDSRMPSQLCQNKVLIVRPSAISTDNRVVKAQCYRPISEDAPPPCPGS